MAAAASDTLRVTVLRGAGAKDHFDHFEVPRAANQTVLDVVTWIQQHLDPTLAYRFACRVGMCGSCAMTVNGSPRWTCRTHVSGVARNGRLEVGPLRNFPIVRDLVVDMNPMFDRWTAAQARHHPGGTRDAPVAEISPQTPQRIAADAAIECINCGVCHAACDTVAGNADYLGPAPLQRAWTVLNDCRDTGRDAVLAAVSGHGGCHNCHSMGSCATHCPVGLRPMDAIAGLKRETVRAALGKGR